MKERTFAQPPTWWLVCTVLVLGAGQPKVTLAQEGAVRPGDRVRLTLPCDTTPDMAAGGVAACEREGTLIRVTADSLRLLVGRDPEAHLLASVRSVEVRRGEGPGWKLPVAAGSVLGGVGTYLWLHSGGSTSLCDRSRNQDAISGRECLGLTVLGGVAGAGLGLLASRLLHTERWIPVAFGRVDLSIGWQGWAR